MTTIFLVWNTNMAALTSCENAIDLFQFHPFLFIQFIHAYPFIARTHLLNLGAWDEI